MLVVAGDVSVVLAVRVRRRHRTGHLGQHGRPAPGTQRPYTLLMSAPSSISPSPDSRYCYVDLFIQVCLCHSYLPSND